MVEPDPGKLWLPDPSAGPSIGEIRLKCLELASARVSAVGPDDEVLSLADRYVAWVTDRDEKPQAQGTRAFMVEVPQDQL